jgi:predicted amidohydrolase YtcJ
VGGAVATGRAHELGRIAPGFAADLAVLSRNPLAVPADELPDITVDLTLLGGQVVYERP